MTDLPDMPTNTELEGALLQSLYEIQGQVGDAIAMGVTEDTFYAPLHKLLWIEAAKAYTAGQEFDELTAFQQIKKDHGELYTLQDINDSLNVVYTVSRATSYIYGCVGMQKKRTLFLGALECLDGIKRDDDPDEVQSKLIARLQESGDTTHQDANIDTETKKVIEDIKERNTKKTKFVGISSGFPLMDYYLGGYRPESMNIIAGRPGMGKTSLALQIVINILLQNIPCRVWSLEMSSQQLLAKMVANLSEVDPNRAKEGLLEAQDFEAMERARYKLTQLPLFISDSSHVTVERIAAQHRRDLAKYDNCMIVIDYLQLMRSGDRKLSREQQISCMSRDLKCLFKDTQSQGIVLSQLNRNADPTKEPELSELRESGSLEQDSDTVMFIYGEGHISLKKNRHGAVGKWPMTFHKPISKLTTN